MAQTSTEPRSGTVQSIERVFELLETIADAGGEISLSDLADASELPMPTIHRLLRTCVTLGYARQLPVPPVRPRCPPDPARGASRPAAGARGPAAAAVAGPAARRDRQHGAAGGRSGGLRRPAAVAARDADVHRGGPARQPARHRGGQGDPGHAVRRRGPRHRRPGRDADADAEEPRHPRVPAGGRGPDPQARLLDRRRGAGAGVRCYAVTVPQAPSPMALSVSGPLSRVDEAFGKRAVPVLQSVAAAIGAALHE